MNGWKSSIQKTFIITYFYVEIKQKLKLVSANKI